MIKKFKDYAISNKTGFKDILFENLLNNGT